MHPKHLSIDDFTYDLPENRIASYPLPERDQSKLLKYKNGQIGEDIYKNMAHHIEENSLLIFNNTKVIAARILFQKSTGGIIEIFCLEPLISLHSGHETNEYNIIMNQKGSATWKCMIGGASKWKTGSLEKNFKIDDQNVKLTATLKEKLPDAWVTEFKWEPGHLSFASILEVAGDIPLPPYIKRKTDLQDKERYQTIYAEHEGSVAAPTAGLHFTPEIFSSLKNKNISTTFVTLHVGAGTFKPVKTSTMELHQMHAEWIDVSAESIKNILDHTGMITAVGTTSLRTMESLYWMGVKIKLKEYITADDLEITQWEVYEEPLVDQNIDPVTALNALLKWMEKNELNRLFTKTQILIAPGYQFKIANALITNFHQPRSTLLLLVAAITKDWKIIYEYALKNEFRFLSYGDGCIIQIRNKE